MPVDMCISYYRCIDKIRANEQLRMYEVINLPHLKNDARTRNIEKIKERASVEKKKILSMDELAAKLKGQ